jgi:hypothetical protein
LENKGISKSLYGLVMQLAVTGQYEDAQERRKADTGRAPTSSIPLHGIFKNFNTIEEFRSAESKKELFNAMTDSVRALCTMYNLGADGTRS